MKKWNVSLWGNFLKLIGNINAFLNQKEKISKQKQEKYFGYGESANRYLLTASGSLCLKRSLKIQCAPPNSSNICFEIYDLLHPPFIFSKSRDVCDKDVYSTGILHCLDLVKERAHYKGKSSREHVHRHPIMMELLSKPLGIHNLLSVLPSFLVISNSHQHLPQANYIVYLK